MTIESVTEMWSRKGSQQERDEDGRFSTTFETAYQVVHSIDATETEIRHATGIPRPGELYPGTPFIFCRTVRREPVGPIMSIVHATYTGGSASDDPTDSPLNAEAVIRWSNATRQREIEFDADGKLITNSIGQPYRGIVKDFSDFVLTVQRNFASINTYALLQYLDSVNSDTFAGWPPGTAALTAYDANAVGTGGVEYWVVNAVVTFRVPYETEAARAWWAQYPNVGLYANYSFDGQIGIGVSFVGGGQGGGDPDRVATGYAVESGGVITKVVTTNGGRGYVTAPTVSFVSNVGSGATATANLSAAGNVDSVTVDAGGSGYKALYFRVVDDFKEPVVHPVPLAKDGRRLKDGERTVLLERKVKKYTLPYNSLGLL